MIHINAVVARRGYGEGLFATAFAIGEQKTRKSFSKPLPAILASSLMALALVAAPGPSTAQAGATMRTVDCAKGLSVQRAIHRAPASKPVVVVEGICT